MTSANIIRCQIGDELPPLIKQPDRGQLVKYAAGSGDFNPLHYDPDFPQTREIGANLVQGRFKYAALGQLDEGPATVAGVGPAGDQAI